MLWRMPGYGSRYWSDRTKPARRPTFPKLRGEHTADVVVIGGGLVGCTAAYGLAAAGLDVILLEGDRLATGATAGSLGGLVPEPDADFASVERLTGRRVARGAWTEARKGTLEFVALLKRLEIKCDLAESALLINARTYLDAPDLRKEQGARKTVGLDAPWLAPPAARRAMGTESEGAIRLRDAFTFDPVRAALGLALAAQKKNARLFERTLVTRTRFTRKDATVVFQGGRIVTRGVVVATGEPGSLFGQLRRHVDRQDGFAVATHPLTAAMRREVGAVGSLVAEAGESRHWMRWLPESRLLFAGAAGPAIPRRLLDKAVVQRTAQLMYELSVRYPAISGLPAAWGWQLPVVSTPDGLPWIGQHRNYPHHFFALAFGWHGDGLSVWAARAAARHFTGQPRREDEAFGFARHL
jgi:glycine/D-amino acid oxidase-like deaminating enzyme